METSPPPQVIGRGQPCARVVGRNNHVRGSVWALANLLAFACWGVYIFSISSSLYLLICQPEVLSFVATFLFLSTWDTPHVHACHPRHRKDTPHLGTVLTTTLNMRRTAYYGTFVHSKSLEELEISHNTAVFVDENGRIAAIEKNLPSVFAAHEVLVRLGWTESTGSAEHVEDVNGNGERRHYDELHKEQDHLEHVGNGVHALSNGASNGHGNGNGNGVSTDINGQVQTKRQGVELVVCGEEEFFFPGFIGKSCCRHLTATANRGS